MKTGKWIVSLSLVTLMALPSASLAQQTGGQQGQQQQPGMQQQQPGMQQQGQQSAQIQQPLRAEDLKDKTLKGQQDEDLGKIENVIIDPQGGSSYAVLSGEEDKMYPIPLNAIQRGEKKDEFRVNISKDQLANAPSYQKDSPPVLSDPQWQQTVHSYYGVQPGQSGQQQQQMQQPQKSQQQPGQQQHQKGMQQPKQQQQPSQQQPSQ